MTRLLILCLLAGIVFSGNCFGQNAEAQRYISTAKEYWKVQNYNQAILYFKKALELSPNDLATQCNIGKAYCLKADIGSPPGESSAENYKQGVYWLRKAADAGFARGQYELGNRYATGDGVVADPKQAAYWWRKAAEQGLPDAQLFLGNHYRDGPGKNLAEAKRWLLKARASSDAITREWAQSSLDEIARGQ